MEKYVKKIKFTLIVQQLVTKLLPTIKKSWESIFMIKLNWLLKLRQLPLLQQLEVRQVLVDHLPLVAADLPLQQPVALDFDPKY